MHYINHTITPIQTVHQESDASLKAISVGRRWNSQSGKSLYSTVLSSLHQSTLLHFPWKHSCDIFAPSIHFTKALCTAETLNLLWVWFSPISGHIHIILVPFMDDSGWDLWVSELGLTMSPQRQRLILFNLSSDSESQRQWLSLLPHSKKVVGSSLLTDWGFFYFFVEFTFLCLNRFPPCTRVSSHSPKAINFTYM